MQFTLKRHGVATTSRPGIAGSDPGIRPQQLLDLLRRLATEGASPVGSPAGVKSAPAASSWASMSIYCARLR